MHSDIDKEISDKLKQQSNELDALVSGGLSNYLKLGFTSGFRGLMKLGYALAIVLTFVIIWCGYEFFSAPADNQIFWGVCLILSFNAQVAVKLWIFMQTNRNIISKEIRLLALRQSTATDV